jgi:glycosyltransferase involved in cell wall biosynthesis
MPLFSVIINVRNGAATLREAIDSVLEQTLPDWELIVWDDRSTDDSASVVSWYNDPRIRYFLSPDDVPLGKARNDALQEALGEWVAFLDQDDVWLPHKLAKQIERASDDVGLIYGRTIRFYANGRERDYDHAHEYEFLPEGDIFARLFSESCFIAMSSAVFRRSAIASIGGIPAEVRIIADYYLYVAVARRYRACAVQEVVCRYRMHPDSMSHTVALDMHREVLWLIELWAAELPAKVVARARKKHFTAIALEEMRSRERFATGLSRLFTEGSVGSQLMRPLAYVVHVVRRIVRPPYWRMLGNRPSM